MKKFISIFLCIAIVFSLSACSFSGGNAVFTIGVAERVNSYNPILASTDAEHMLLANCFEGLLRFDEKGNISLAGATAYTTEKYGLSYVFKLNPNARWHTNSETKDIIKALGIDNFDKKIKADDYVFGFKRFMEASTALDSIKEIKATDDYTLQITLSREDYDLLYKLAALPLYPCNEAFFKASGEEYGKTFSHMLYNGPYYVEQAGENETIISRNRDYNGNIQVKAKEIHIFTNSDKKALSDQFNNKTHNLYIADSIGNEIKNTEAISYSYSEVWGIAFNCKSKLGSSKAFREVLSGSITKPKEIATPAFALTKAESVFPSTYTVGVRVFSDFAKEPAEYKGSAEKALKTLTALQNKYKVKSYSVKFAAPYDMKPAAEKIIEEWESIFGEKVKVTLSLYNKEEASEIADEAEYDIAIIPISAENRTASSLFNAIPSAPCYFGNNDLWDLGKSISVIATNNFKVYADTEKLLIENSVFIPLFYTGKALYIDNSFNGVYLADGGRLIYFHSGAEV